MKRFYFKPLCWLIIACIMLTSLPSVDVSAAKATDYSEFFGYTQMKTDTQRDAYVRMAEAIVNMDANGVTFKAGTITPEKISEIAMLLPYDLPQAFYFRGPHYLNRYSNGDIQFIPVFLLNADGNFAETEEEIKEVARQKAALDAKVKQIISNIPSSVDTDYEKSVYVYDLVVGMAEYVKTEHDQTAYGALVEGKCVCAGYAAAYMLLMRELGVKTWMVYGIANNGRETEAHAWNVSWINGDCVYTDPTWGDLDGITRYTYLNISGAEMAKDHYWNEQYESVLYECDHIGHKHETQSVKVQAIELPANTKKTYKLGETYQIKCRVVPENADNKALTCASSDPSVATVSSTGLIAAVGEGTATITIRSVDGGALSTIDVVVKQPACEHQLALVKLVPATCKTKGVKAHYCCSGCGSLFLDKNGFLPVEEDRLEISMAPHSPGTHIFDDDAHWQVCVDCAELVGERSQHEFGGSSVCRICSYKRDEVIIKPVEPTNPKPPDETNPSEPTQTTEPDIPTLPSETEPHPLPTEATASSPTDGTGDEGAAGLNVGVPAALVAFVLLSFAVYFSRRKKSAQKS